MFNDDYGFNITKTANRCRQHLDRDLNPRRIAYGACVASTPFCLARGEIRTGQKFLGAFAKLRKAAVSFVVSVRPRATTRLPLDGFS
jgi:hypothetical protein